MAEVTGHGSESLTVLTNLSSRVRLVYLSIFWYLEIESFSFDKLYKDNKITMILLCKMSC